MNPSGTNSFPCGLSSRQLEQLPYNACGLCEEEDGCLTMFVNNPNVPFGSKKYGQLLKRWRKAEGIGWKPRVIKRSLFASNWTWTLRRGGEEYSDSTNIFDQLAKNLC